MRKTSEKKEAEKLINAECIACMGNTPEKKEVEKKNAECIPYMRNVAEE